MRNEPSAHKLELLLFGNFEARRNNMPIEGLHLRKCERILAYLALRDGEWVETKRLASDLWRGSPTEDPAANFRQSLRHLRNALQSDKDCVQSRVGSVRLDISLVYTDLSQFEEACRRGDAASLAFAREICEEPLLAEWSDSWIEPQRVRLERKLQCAANRLEHADHRPGVLSSSVMPARRAGHQPNSNTGVAMSAGGAMSLNSIAYIERSADSSLCAALDRQESIIVLKGARQTGKTSLLARGLQHARQLGWVVHHIDCELFSSEDIAVRDRFYLRVIALIAEQANIEFMPDADWKPHLGANGNLERFLRRSVLAGTSEPILWAIDHVDCLFKTPYYNEFFALIRGLHSRRATEPAVAWCRLTTLIAAATEAHLYIQDLSQSPFNVGERIAVEDFSCVQQLDLAKRYGLTDTGDAQRLFDLLGGNPYLLTRALCYMRDEGLGATAFVDYVLQSNGPFHDHIEGILRLLTADRGLCEDMRAVLERRACSDSGFFRLRTAGLIAGNSPGAAVPRCGLYAHYFGSRLT